MNRTVVVDYGCGNLLSVLRAVERVGAEARIASTPQDILDAERLILPGVGAFAKAYEALCKLDLVDAIVKTSMRGTPILGICLGMQLLFSESEEFGLTKGLGIIPGRVQSIPQLNQDGLPLRIPHIGWNELLPAGGASWGGTALNGLSAKDAVYFVHSFMGQPEDRSMLLAECLYGGHKIPAVVSNRNVLGCQFHPEKSGFIGLKILRSFCGT